MLVSAGKSCSPGVSGAWTACASLAEVAVPNGEPNNQPAWHFMLIFSRLFLPNKYCGKSVMLVVLVEAWSIIVSAFCGCRRQARTSNKRMFCTQSMYDCDGHHDAT